MIILDTNVILRVAYERGTEEVSRSTREFVVDSQRRGEAAISAATIWEVGELADKGRLQVNLALFMERLADDRVITIPIDAKIAARSVQLRREWADNDPADRFIVATALLTNSQLVTTDTALIAWDGPIQVVDARS